MLTLMQRCIDVRQQLLKTSKRPCVFAGSVPGNTIYGSDARKIYFLSRDFTNWYQQVYDTKLMLDQLSQIMAALLETMCLEVFQRQLLKEKQKINTKIMASTQTGRHFSFNQRV